MEPMKGFYMVWCRNGAAPTYQHETFEAARAEAERLARKNPGHSFVVLSALGQVTLRDVEWQGAETTNDLPF